MEQQAWIQNKTIRDNILFDQPYDEEKYLRTIQACQLVSDLKILTGGDMTEIGAKGINLSGGQKARISLARAVYSNCDVILMDDPISALDMHVRRKIFNDVFQGICAEKTRILVTHAIDYLSLCDRIVLMKNGQITAVGTHKELESNETLQEVLKIHSANTSEVAQLSDTQS